MPSVLLPIDYEVTAPKQPTEPTAPTEPNPNAS